ncbi:nuclear transport factor 2 family protein [Winogradskyella sp.]|uniref:nuclear transport factor 2 family protein n=1 Tax=Winogradskyella sp. TaxID=1883156 RepID=UPI003F6AC1E8
MKNFLIITALCIGLNSYSQKSENENENVKQAIISFFDALHKQDSTALKSMAKGNIKMQSISVNKDGETVLQERNYDDFVKNITSIPKDRSFEEKLLGFTINVDGNMANAWTPYEFWYNGKFSHCGVNSFQLIKKEDTWKIIYLVDTRRRDDCQ